MKRLVAVIAAAGLFCIACGPSPANLDKAEARLQVLTTKGIPDSLLSGVKASIYGARDALSKSKGQELTEYYKAAIKQLVAAEKSFSATLTLSAQQIDSLRNLVKVSRGELSGLHLNFLDSIITRSDSFGMVNLPYQQSQTLNQAVAWSSVLKELQGKANEINSKVPGVWSCEELTTKEGDKKVNALKESIFNFGTDNNVVFTERKKGQSSPFLKEDWQYVSKGTWALRGDTVYLSISHFAATRQSFWNKVIGSKKDEWVKDDKGSYDSTITDKSQDRSVAWYDLERDFKKK